MHRQVLRLTLGKASCIEISPLNMRAPVSIRQNPVIAQGSQSCHQILLFSKEPFTVSLCSARTGEEIATTTSYEDEI
jgi:hypothetical protein